MGVSVVPSTFEKSFVVLVLLLSTNAFLNLSSPANTAGDADSGMPLMQGLWAALYAITFGLAFKHSTQLISSLRRNVWLVLLLAFTVSSVFWSDDPTLSLRRGVALVCTTIFGLYFAERYPLHQQLRLLGVAYGLAAGFSLIFQVLGLGTAVDIDVPGWIGIYDQKNVLGINMVFATAVLLLVRRSDPRYRDWATLGLIIVISLLLLSQSMTAIVMRRARAGSIDNTGRWTLNGGLTVNASITANGSGLKHKRVAGCTTAAVFGNLCSTVINWDTAFANVDYTVSCTGDGVASGVPLSGGITAKTPTSVIFRTVAGASAEAQYRTIDCIAMHD